MCLLPHHPGWGRSERPAWMRSVRDLAAMHQWLLAELDVTDCALLGLGFGGWIAAEMASLAPRQFHRLVLVGAHGVKPPQGDILDQAIISYIAYPHAGFHDQEAFHRVYGEVSDRPARTMGHRPRNVLPRGVETVHVQPDLPHLLGGVRSPALVVWGDEDRIVPRSAADIYVSALRQARLEIVPGCGHFVDMEKPDELAKLVVSFVTAD